MTVRTALRQVLLDARTGGGECLAAELEAGLSTMDLALLTIGAVVLLLGLLSGWVRESLLSEPLIALVAGMLLGPGVTRLLDLNRFGDPYEILRHGIRLTLAISLMGVALRLPRGQLRQHSRTLMTLLGVGMPAMWIVSALLAWLIAGVPAPLAILVGAAITPTDPVVAAAIVTGKVAESNLPSRIRHVLSAESGANDGLALPFVAAGIVLATGQGGDWGHWFLKSILLEVGGALVFGGGAGFLAGRLLEWALRKNEIEKTSRLAYTVALSLTALGGASLLHLNEVLAVFVTGLSFDRAVSQRDRTEEQGIQEAINRFFMLPIFVLLGTALPWQDWAALGLRGVFLVLAVLLVRRLPTILLLSPLLFNARRRADALYVGWFGPIGVAALYYSLQAKERTGSVLPWSVVTMVVVASLLVHGVSATPLTKLYGKRGGRSEVAREREEANP